MEKDFAGLTSESVKTTGQKLYLRQGITGVRGQAEAGFPAVLEVGLPEPEEGLVKGLSLNDAGCAALLEKDPFPGEDLLKRMDADFIDKNLSPGGSANLLAITYFLYLLKKK